MNKVKEYIKDPCAICRVREVTSYCDFVVGYYWTTMKDEHGNMIGPTHETCDLPICDECSHKHISFDFCPYHTKMLPDIKLKDDKLQRRKTGHWGKVLGDFHKE